MGRFTGILGVLTMLGLAFAFSTNRRAIRVKTVASVLVLHAALAAFVLKAVSVRRTNGRIHRVWHRAQAAAERGDHDRTGDDSDFQNAGTGNRAAKDGWAGCNEREGS